MTERDRRPANEPSTGGSGPQDDGHLGGLGGDNLLQAIFHTAKDGIFVKDADLRYVKVNRAMCEMWGLSEEELIGKTARQAFGEQIGDAAKREDRRVLQGRVVEDETEHTAGTVVRVCSSIKVPLCNVQGEVIGICGVTRDVTARKWSEQALRKSERRLATLMNNLPGMVYRCRNDRQWTMEFVSEGSEALLGYPPQDLVGNARVAFGDLVHPDDADRVWDGVQAMLSRGEAFELEYRVRTASGQIRWVAERGVGVTEEDEGPGIIEGFIADVTRRVEADEALRRRLELESLVARVAASFVRVGLDDLDAAVVDALREIAAFSDADRVYVSTLTGPEERINLAFHWSAHGVEPPQKRLGGRSFREFPWWRKVLLQDAPISVSDVLDVPERATNEADYWSSLGARAVLGVPLWYAQDLIGYVVLHNVREARAWREEDLALLRSVGPVLAHALIRAKTESEKRGLEHQLQHAQKVEAIGRLAGGVAHDFNNLLTAISGYAELALEAQAAGAAPDDDIQEILKAAERATALTQQLLAFSRRQEQRPRLVNLNEVILNSQKMLQRMIGEDVVLDVQLADDLRAIEMDPGQVDQMLLNLAVNARDAMPAGGRLLLHTQNVVLDEEFCRPRERLEPGHYVLMEVADTGVGMDPETLERIFDPFFTTKDVGKGTGLGLSTVYGVVSQNRGTVDVRSEPGEGASFRIFLPAAGVGPQASTEIDEPIGEAVGGAETVLVVEDDPAVRRLARQVLENHGYRVLELDAGDRALELCRDQAEGIDLVVSDVVMPGMSGRELAAVLRERHPSIAVVLTSGYEPERVGDGSDIPLLSKPFSAADLLRTVRQALDGRSGEASSDV